MKRIIILNLIFLGICARGQSQTILTEDFDSYNTNQPLSESSPGWSSIFIGFPDPVGVITSAESNSPQNSLVQDGTLFIQNNLGITISSGILTTQMALKIPTGKKFSFEFGAPGTEVLFSNGVITVYNENGVALSTYSGYPQDTWFLFKVEANLDLSTWKNYINNQQVGTEYANFAQLPFSTLRIQAFDMANQGMDNYNFQAWIDDISMTKTTSSAANFDLSVVQVQPDYGVVAQHKKVKARIKNLGQTTINSATITMNYDNGAVVSTRNLTNLNLQTQDNKIIEFNDPIVLNNNKTITVTLSNINNSVDDNVVNNSNSYLIEGLITPTPNKKIYIEEATGFWCGFCPQARVQVEWLQHNYGEFFEVAEIHDTDPLMVAGYIATDLLGVEGFPTVLFDRDTNSYALFQEGVLNQGIYQNSLYVFPIDAPIFFDRLQTPVHAVVNPTFTYNTVTRALAVNVDYVFNSATSNYKVACVLTEDSLSGPGDGVPNTYDYDQVNYFSGSNHIFTPDTVDLHDLPNPIPGTQMVYNHVGRIISPSINGVGIGNTSAGQTVSHTFNFVVNPTWNPANIKIIALLIDDTGRVDNAQSALLADAFLNVGDLTANTANFSVYPNPTNDMCTVQFAHPLEEQAIITIVGVDGRIVGKQTFLPDPSSNTAKIDLGTLEAGNYVVSIRQGNALQSFKITKTH